MASEDVAWAPAAPPVSRLEGARRNAGFQGTSLHTLVQMVDNGLGTTLLPQLRHAVHWSVACYAQPSPVQGAATATASTPVKKAPRLPPRDASPSPAVMEPISNRPDRLRPTAKTRSAKPATAMGD